MEGAPVLITEFGEGICFNLLEFLVAKKAAPFVFVKDFERMQDVFENFPAAIPIVLDFHRNMESTIDLLSALPTMSCVFNLDGETMENLYRQTFEHFHKTITIHADDFDSKKVYNEMMDAITDGYTLMVNFLSLTVSTPMSSNPASVEETLMPESDQLAATTSSASNPARNLKVIFEKLFFRHPEVLADHKLPLKSKKDKERLSAQGRREGNSISELFKKMFTKMNPCSTISVLNLLPSRSRGASIKSPEEISKYIKSQEIDEIKVAFQTIHESALRNWTVIGEEDFQFTLLQYEEQFATMCQEIERRGEEGRKVLLDKINKDIERTKQWDHVLGAKAINRLRTSREMEIEMKVQHFCKRKVAEARKKINDEIQEKRDRAKARFYEEILEEQIMELLRIKEKYEKRKDLLMLPYTGELKILN